MNRKFSAHSEKNLANIHPDLIRIVRRCLEISRDDFCVIEGLRSVERQKQLVREGLSKTQNSRHLTGHAVDIAPVIHGKIPWNHWQSFEVLAESMKKSAQELGINIIWGGDWKTFKDGVHFELEKTAITHNHTATR
ncbi:M15 family metallopeptidase [Enterobacteriaceae bacterium 4M9]|nr:M15 family metallopeptidase [Enterobacteriaceae bacterium 4M9]